jgi:ATP-dependent Clp protease ATP-binding subunit ClpA
VLAADDQPDLAISLLEEATAKLAQDRESQRTAVDEKYNRIVRNEITKQQAEFATLKENFDAHMNLIQLAHEDEVRTEHRKTTIFIQRTLLKGINDCCSGLKARRYRPRVTEELTKYVREFLDTKEKGFLLVVE